MQDLEVCAPAPPTCGSNGWLVEANNAGIHGVECESSIPAAESFEIPDPPTGEEVYGETATAVGDDDPESSSGGGCSSTGSAGGIGSGLLLLFGTFRRRRRRR